MIDADSDPNDVEKLKVELRKRGMVNTAKYSVATKRWRNEEVKCVTCKRWYGLNEQDHHARFCTGNPGTPLAENDTPYLLSRCKRFRHLNWKTP